MAAGASNDPIPFGDGGQEEAGAPVTMGPPDQQQQPAAAAGVEVPPDSPGQEQEFEAEVPVPSVR